MPWRLLKECWREEYEHYSILMKNCLVSFLENRTTDAIFLVRRLQEEHRAKDKQMYMCFVNLEKAFDRVPRRVMEWATGKKDLPEILVKAVMSLYEGSETKIRFGSRLSEKLWKLVCTMDLCLCYLQYWWMKLRKMQEKAGQSEFLMRKIWS